MIENILKNKERIKIRKASAIPGVCNMVLGASMAVLGYSDMVEKGLFSELLMTIGLVVWVVGIVKLARLGDVYVDKVSGCELIGYHLFYGQQDLKRLESLLDAKQFAELARIRVCPQGGVALHIYGTMEGGLFYLQLMKYVPFEFVPLSDVVELTAKEDLDQVSVLIQKQC